MSNDLDQGGTARQWTNVYLGPSIGWVRDLLSFPTATTVTGGGGFTAPAGTSVVNVNVNAAVTVQLPSSTTTGPVVPGITIPPLTNPPTMTIVDIGGFAGAFPISIIPFGSEKINKQGGAQITTAFGALTLIPIATGGWNIAP